MASAGEPAAGATERKRTHKLRPYPKIGRLDSRLLSNIQRHAAGRSLVFWGTVKLHGTNTAVVETSAGELYPQGRTCVLSADFPGVANFAGFVAEPRRTAALREALAAVRRAVAELHPDWRERRFSVVYYGEYCGPRVQKGVAISALRKPEFFGFSLRAVDEATEEDLWMDLLLNTPAAPAEGKGKDKGKKILPLHLFDRPELGLHRIAAFPGAVCRVTVDSADAAAAEATFERMAAEAEARCPVAAALGHTGRGEGWIFRAEEPWSEDLRPRYTEWPFPLFKAKGASWSDTKPPRKSATAASRAAAAGDGKDDGGATAIADLVGRTVTEVRLLKGIDHLRENKAAGGGDHWSVREHTGGLVKWVTADIETEEADEVAQLVATERPAGALRRAIGKAVSEWFSMNVHRLNREAAEAAAEAAAALTDA